MTSATEAPETASDGTPYLTIEAIEVQPALMEFTMQPGWAYDDHRRVWFGPTPTYAPAKRRTEYSRGAE